MSEPNNGGPAMADPFEAIRAHVEKNASKERATFTVAGVKALLAAVDAAALSAAAQPGQVKERLVHELGRVYWAAHHDRIDANVLEAMADACLALLPTTQAGECSEAAWRDIPVTDETLDYVSKYGGRCRDCADNFGVCPSGLPCKLEERRAAIRQVLLAINYGMTHGFLAPPPSPAQGTVVRAEPVDPYPSKDELITSLLKQVAELKKCQICGSVERCEACNEVNELAATHRSAPVAFIVERLDGTKRYVVLADKNDPRKSSYWVNEDRRAEYRVTPLYASPPVDSDALKAARRKLELWFFRDLVDRDRLVLFSIFGLPVDEIGTTHGHQQKALKHVVAALSSQGSRSDE